MVFTSVGLALRFVKRSSLLVSRPYALDWKPAMMSVNNNWEPKLSPGLSHPPWPTSSKRVFSLSRSEYTYFVVFQSRTQMRWLTLSVWY
jgi:hypothetical protein